MAVEPYSSLNEFIRVLKHYGIIHIKQVLLPSSGHHLTLFRLGKTVAKASLARFGFGLRNRNGLVAVLRVRKSGERSER
jgi:hypothetical protein